MYVSVDMPGTLELELQVIASCTVVGAENCTWVPWKSSMCSLIAEPSLQSLLCIVLSNLAA